MAAGAARKRVPFLRRQIIARLRLACFISSCTPLPRAAPSPESDPDNDRLCHQRLSVAKLLAVRQEEKASAGDFPHPAGYPRPDDGLRGSGAQHGRRIAEPRKRRSSRWIHGTGDKDRDHETRAGKPRVESLKDMAERTMVDDVKSFVSMLTQTEFGTSLSEGLRSYADSLRVKKTDGGRSRRQNDHQDDFFRLMFFIFPALLVVI